MIRRPGNPAESEHVLLDIGRDAWAPLRVRHLSARDSAPVFARHSARRGAMGGAYDGQAALNGHGTRRNGDMDSPDSFVPHCPKISGRERHGERMTWGRNV